MLETALASVLNRYIGPYVENLDTSQLKIGIFSGNVSLKNIILRQNALKELFGLPLKIVKGCIGTISFDISLSSLRSKPIVLEIDDIHVAIVPDYAGASLVKELVAIRDKKKDALLKLEQHLVAQQVHVLRVQNNLPSLANTKDSIDDDDVQLFEGLLASAIANLQIRISRVHIRYEHQVSVVPRPGRSRPYQRSIVIGLTLSELTISTAKDQSNSSTARKTVVCKEVTLKGLSIYCDTVVQPSPTAAILSSRFTLNPNGTTSASSIPQFNEIFHAQSILGQISKPISSKGSSSGLGFFRSSTKSDTNSTYTSSLASSSRLNEEEPGRAQMSIYEMERLARSYLLSHTYVLEPCEISAQLTFPIGYPRDLPKADIAVSITTLHCNLADKQVSCFYRVLIDHVNAWDRRLLCLPPPVPTGGDMPPKLLTPGRPKKGAVVPPEKALLRKKCRVLFSALLARYRYACTERDRQSYLASALPVYARLYLRRLALSEALGYPALSAEERRYCLALEMSPFLPLSLILRVRHRVEAALRESLSLPLVDASVRRDVEIHYWGTVIKELQPSLVGLKPPTESIHPTPSNREHSRALQSDLNNRLDNIQEESIPSKGFFASLLRKASAEAGSSADRAPQRGKPVPSREHESGTSYPSLLQSLGYRIDPDTGKVSPLTGGSSLVETAGLGQKLSPNYILVRFLFRINGLNVTFAQVKSIPITPRMQRTNTSVLGPLMPGTITASGTLTPISQLRVYGVSLGVDYSIGSIAFGVDIGNVVLVDTGPSRDETKAVALTMQRGLQSRANAEPVLAHRYIIFGEQNSDSLEATVTKSSKLSLGYLASQTSKPNHPDYVNVPAKSRVDDPKFIGSDKSGAEVELSFLGEHVTVASIAEEPFRTSEYYNPAFLGGGGLSTNPIPRYLLSVRLLTNPPPPKEDDSLADTGTLSSEELADQPKHAGRLPALANSVGADEHARTAHYDSDDDEFGVAPGSNISPVDSRTLGKPIRTSSVLWDGDSDATPDEDFTSELLRARTRTPKAHQRRKRMQDESSDGELIESNANPDIADGGRNRRMKASPKNSNRTKGDEQLSSGEHNKKNHNAWIRVRALAQSVVATWSVPFVQRMYQWSLTAFDPRLEALGTSLENIPYTLPLTSSLSHYFHYSNFYGGGQDFSVALQGAILSSRSQLDIRCHLKAPIIVIPANAYYTPSAPSTTRGLQSQMSFRSHISEDTGNSEPNSTMLIVQLGTIEIFSPPAPKGQFSLSLRRHISAKIPSSEHPVDALLHSSRPFFPYSYDRYIVYMRDLSIQLVQRSIDDSEQPFVGFGSSYVSEEVYDPVLHDRITGSSEQVIIPGLPAEVSAWSTPARSATKALESSRRSKVHISTSREDRIRDSEDTVQSKSLLSESVSIETYGSPRILWNRSSTLPVLNNVDIRTLVGMRSSRMEGRTLHPLPSMRVAVYIPNVNVSLSIQALVRLMNVGFSAFMPISELTRESSGHIGDSTVQNVNTLISRLTTNTLEGDDEEGPLNNPAYFVRLKKRALIYQQMARELDEVTSVSYGSPMPIFPPFNFAPRSFFNIHRPLDAVARDVKALVMHQRQSSQKEMAQPSGLVRLTRPAGRGGKRGERSRNPVITAATEETTLSQADSSHSKTLFLLFEAKLDLFSIHLTLPSSRNQWKATDSNSYTFDIVLSFRECQVGFQQLRQGFLLQSSLGGFTLYACGGNSPRALLLSLMLSAYGGAQETNSGEKEEKGQSNDVHYHAQHPLLSPNAPPTFAAQNGTTTSAPQTVTTYAATRTVFHLQLSEMVISHVRIASSEMLRAMLGFNPNSIAQGSPLENLNVQLHGTNPSAAPLVGTPTATSKRRFRKGQKEESSDSAQKLKAPDVQRRDPVVPTWLQELLVDSVALTQPLSAHVAILLWNRKTYSAPAMSIDPSQQLELLNLRTGRSTAHYSRHRSFRRERAISMDIFPSLHNSIPVPMEDMNSSRGILDENVPEVQKQRIIVRLGSLALTLTPSDVSLLVVLFSSIANGFSLVATEFADGLKHISAPASSTPESFAVDSDEDASPKLSPSVNGNYKESPGIGASKSMQVQKMDEMYASIDAERESVTNREKDWVAQITTEDRSIFHSVTQISSQLAPLEVKCIVDFVSVALFTTNGKIKESKSHTGKIDTSELLRMIAQSNEVRQPLLRISLSNSHLHYFGSRMFASVSLHCEFRNSRIQKWEPILEPWTLAMKVSSSMLGQPFALSLHPGEIPHKGDDLDVDKLPLMQDTFVNLQAQTSLSVVVSSSLLQVAPLIVEAVTDIQKVTMQLVEFTESLASNNSETGHSNRFSTGSTQSPFHSDPVALELREASSSNSAYTFHNSTGNVVQIWSTSQSYTNECAATRSNKYNVRSPVAIIPSGSTIPLGSELLTRLPVCARANHMSLLDGNKASFVGYSKGKSYTSMDLHTPTPFVDVIPTLSTSSLHHLSLRVSDNDKYVPPDYRLDEFGLKRSQEELVEEKDSLYSNWFLPVIASGTTAQRKSQDTIALTFQLAGYECVLQEPLVPDESKIVTFRPLRDNPSTHQELGNNQILMLPLAASPLLSYKMQGKSSRNVRPLGLEVIEDVANDIYSTLRNSELSNATLRKSMLDQLYRKYEKVHWPEPSESECYDILRDWSATVKEELRRLRRSFPVQHALLHCTQRFHGAKSVFLESLHNITNSTNTALVIRLVPHTASRFGSWTQDIDVCAQSMERMERYSILLYQSLRLLQKIALERKVADSPRRNRMGSFSVSTKQSMSQIARSNSTRSVRSGSGNLLEGSEREHAASHSDAAANLPFSCQEAYAGGLPLDRVLLPGLSWNIPLPYAYSRIFVRPATQVDFEEAHAFGFGNGLSVCKMNDIIQTQATEDSAVYVPNVSAPSSSRPVYEMPTRESSSSPGGFSTPEIDLLSTPLNSRRSKVLSSDQSPDPHAPLLHTNSRSSSPFSRSGGSRHSRDQLSSIGESDASKDTHDTQGAPRVSRFRSRRAPVSDSKGLATPVAQPNPDVTPARPKLEIRAKDSSPSPTSSLSRSRTSSVVRGDDGHSRSFPNASKPSSFENGIESMDVGSVQDSTGDMDENRVWIYDFRYQWSVFEPPPRALRWNNPNAPGQSIFNKVKDVVGKKTDDLGLGSLALLPTYEDFEKENLADAYKSTGVSQSEESLSTYGFSLQELQTSAVQVITQRHKRFLGQLQSLAESSGVPSHPADADAAGAASCAHDEETLNTYERTSVAVCSRDKSEEATLLTAAADAKASKALGTEASGGTAVGALTSQLFYYVHKSCQVTQASRYLQHLHISDENSKQVSPASTTANNPSESKSSSSSLEPPPSSASLRSARSRRNRDEAASAAQPDLESLTQSKPRADESFDFSVMPVTVDIVISAPLEIENGLPCDLAFQIGVSIDPEETDITLASTKGSDESRMSRNIDHSSNGNALSSLAFDSTSKENAITQASQDNTNEDTESPTALETPGKKSRFMNFFRKNKQEVKPAPTTDSASVPEQKSLAPPTPAPRRLSYTSDKSGSIASSHSAFRDVDDDVEDIDNYSSIVTISSGKLCPSQTVSLLYAHPHPPSFTLSSSSNRTVFATGPSRTRFRSRVASARYARRLFYRVRLEGTGLLWSPWMGLWVPSSGKDREALSTVLTVDGSTVSSLPPLPFETMKEPLLPTRTLPLYDGTDHASYLQAEYSLSRIAPAYDTNDDEPNTLSLLGFSSIASSATPAPPPVFSMKINVFSKYWLVNTTGIPITYSTHISEKDAVGAGASEAAKLRSIHAIVPAPGQLTPVTVETWENERYLFMKWGKKLLPTDRQPWSDRFGKSKVPLHKESFRLPSSQWAWEGPWRVDTDWCNGQCDAEGWQYNTDFPRFGKDSGWTSTFHPLQSVRRRKWVRTRLPPASVSTDSAQIRSSLLASRKRGAMSDSGSIWERSSLASSFYGTQSGQFTLTGSFSGQSQSYSSEVDARRTENGVSLSAGELLSLGVFLHTPPPGAEAQLAIRVGTQGTWSFPFPINTLGRPGIVSVTGADLTTPPRGLLPSKSKDASLISRLDIAVNPIMATKFLPDPVFEKSIAVSLSPRYILINKLDTHLNHTAANNLSSSDIHEGLENPLNQIGMFFIQVTQTATHNADGICNPCQALLKYSEKGIVPNTYGLFESRYDVGSTLLDFLSTPDISNTDLYESNRFESSFTGIQEEDEGVIDGDVTSISKLSVGEFDLSQFLLPLSASPVPPVLTVPPGEHSPYFYPIAPGTPEQRVESTGSKGTNNGHDDSAEPKASDLVSIRVVCLFRPTSNAPERLKDSLRSSTPKGDTNSYNTFVVPVTEWSGGISISKFGQCPVRLIRSNAFNLYAKTVGVPPYLLHTTADELIVRVNVQADVSSSSALVTFTGERGFAPFVHVVKVLEIVEQQKKLLQQKSRLQYKSGIHNRLSSQGSSMFDAASISKQPRSGASQGSHILSTPVDILSDFISPVFWYNGVGEISHSYTLALVREHQSYLQEMRKDPLLRNVSSNNKLVTTHLPPVYRIDNYTDDSFVVYQGGVNGRRALVVPPRSSFPIAWTEPCLNWSLPDEESGSKSAQAGSNSKILGGKLSLISSKFASIADRIQERLGVSRIEEVQGLSLAITPMAVPINAKTSNATSSSHLPSLPTLFVNFSRYGESLRVQYPVSKKIEDETALYRFATPFDNPPDLSSAQSSIERFQDPPADQSTISPLLYNTPVYMHSRSGGIWALEGMQQRPSLWGLKYQDNDLLTMLTPSGIIPLKTKTLSKDKRADAGVSKRESNRKQQLENSNQYPLTPHKSREFHAKKLREFPIGRPTYCAMTKVTEYSGASAAFQLRRETELSKRTRRRAEQDSSGHPIYFEPANAYFGYEGIPNSQNATSHDNETSGIHLPEMNPGAVPVHYGDLVFIRMDYALHIGEGKTGRVVPLYLVCYEDGTVQWLQRDVALATALPQVPLPKPPSELNDDSVSAPKHMVASSAFLVTGGPPGQPVRMCNPSIWDVLYQQGFDGIRELSSVSMQTNARTTVDTSAVRLTNGFALLPIAFPDRLVEGSYVTARTISDPRTAGISMGLRQCKLPTLSVMSSKDSSNSSNPPNTNPLRKTEDSNQNETPQDGAGQPGEKFVSSMQRRRLEAQARLRAQKLSSNDATVDESVVKGTTVTGVGAGVFSPAADIPLELSTRTRIPTVCDLVISAWQSTQLAEASKDGVSPDLDTSGDVYAETPLATSEPTGLPEILQTLYPETVPVSCFFYASPLHSLLLPHRSVEALVELEGATRVISLRSTVLSNGDAKVEASVVSATKKLQDPAALAPPRPLPRTLVSLNLFSISLSILDHLPRELLLLTLFNMRLQLLQVEHSIACSLTLHDIQIDNQIPGTTFPIVLSRVAKSPPQLLPHEKVALPNVEELMDIAMNKETITRNSSSEIIAMTSTSSNSESNSAASSQSGDSSFPPDILCMSFLFQQTGVGSDEVVQLHNSAIAPSIAAKTEKKAQKKELRGPIVVHFPYIAFRMLELSTNLEEGLFRTLIQSIPFHLLRKTTPLPATNQGKAKGSARQKLYAFSSAATSALVSAANVKLDKAALRVAYSLGMSNPEKLSGHLKRVTQNTGASLRADLNKLSAAGVKIHQKAGIAVTKVTGNATEALTSQARKVLRSTSRISGSMHSGNRDESRQGMDSSKDLGRSSSAPRPTRPPLAGDGRGMNRGSMRSSDAVSAATAPKKLKPTLSSQYLSSANVDTLTPLLSVLSWWKPEHLSTINASHGNATMLFHIGTLIIHPVALQLSLRRESSKEAPTKGGNVSTTPTHSRETDTAQHSSQLVRRSRAKKGIVTSSFSLVTSPIFSTLNAVSIMALSLDKSSIFLMPLQLGNILSSPDELTGRIISHYVSAALAEVYKILSSVDILGNPAKILSSVRQGALDFFMQPLQGLQESPSSFGKGLVSGSASLVTNTLGGIGGGVLSLSGALSRGAATLAFDNEYTMDRRNKANSQSDKPRNVATGLLLGTKELGKGILQGVTGVVVDPIQGASRGGVKGFFKGVGKGLSGLVIKPVVGAIDLTQKTTEGIISTTNALTQGMAPPEPPELIRFRAPRLLWGIHRCVLPVTPVHPIIISVLRSLLENLVITRRREIVLQRLAIGSSPQEVLSIVKNLFSEQKELDLSRIRDSSFNPGSFKTLEALHSSTDSATASTLFSLLSGQDIAFRNAQWMIGQTYLYHVLFPHTPYLLIVTTQVVVVARVHRSALIVNTSRSDNTSQTIHLAWQMPVVSPAALEAYRASDSSLGPFNSSTTHGPSGSGAPMTPGMLCGHFFFCNILTAMAELIREASMAVYSSKVGHLGLAPKKGPSNQSRTSDNSSMSRGLNSDKSHNQSTLSDNILRTPTRNALSVSSLFSPDRNHRDGSIAPGPTTSGAPRIEDIREERIEKVEQSLPFPPPQVTPLALVLLDNEFRRRLESLSTLPCWHEIFNIPTPFVFALAPLHFSVTNPIPPELDPFSASLPRPLLQYLEANLVPLHFGDAMSSFSNVRFNEHPQKNIKTIDDAIVYMHTAFRTYNRAKARCMRKFLEIEANAGRYKPSLGVAGESAVGNDTALGSTSRGKSRHTSNRDKDSTTMQNKRVNGSTAPDYSVVEEAIQILETCREIPEDDLVHLIVYSFSRAALDRPILSLTICKAYDKHQFRGGAHTLSLVQEAIYTILSMRMPSLEANIGVQ